MSLQNTMIFWRQTFWKKLTKLGNAYIVIPIAIFFAIVDRVIGIKLLIGIVGISASATIIRLVYFKQRPKKRPANTILSRIDASSFPSIHAARGFFFAMVLTRYYQSQTMGIILFALAIIVAYSRYALRHHYASDIIGGAILGIIVGYSVEVQWIISKVPGL